MKITNKIITRTEISSEVFIQYEDFNFKFHCEVVFWSGFKIIQRLKINAYDRTAFQKLKKSERKAIKKQVSDYLINEKE